MSEQLLVVERQLLFKEKEFQGFTPDFNIEFRHIDVQPRDEMEEDPRYKQLVSYVVCVSPQGEYLVYKRLKGGGEKRLHAKYSIGVGGHMNPILAQDALLENAKRELQEEIGVVPALSRIGYINDDSNAVGQVHFGVVYLAIVDPEDVRITETDTLSVEWLPKDQLPIDQLENWSKLLIDHL